MSDEVNVHVTAGTSEDASMVASVIGEALNNAGFTNVAVEPSMLDSAGSSYLDIIREVNPGLLDAAVNVSYGSFGEPVSDEEG